MLVNGTAIADQDYSGVFGTLTSPPIRRLHFSVTIVRTRGRGDETVLLSLRDSRRRGHRRAEHGGLTITDNDSAARFSSAPPYKSQKETAIRSRKAPGRLAGTGTVAIRVPVAIISTTSKPLRGL